MKILVVIFISMLSLSAFTKTFENEFKFYIIKPKFRLNWNSPRSIGITTGLNSIRKDYAPIGHFAVELNCSEPNKLGVSHVLTGMERLDKKKAQEIVLKKKLALGSVLYNFEGNLQGAELSRWEIEEARKDGRLTEVTIPTTAQRCQTGLNFIESWINYGSYTIYGGNKDVFNGEGSGCADFALALFHIGTSIVPREDIIARVKIPARLIGDGKGKRVPFWKTIFTKDWASENEKGTEYVTPDTNKVTDFLESNSLAFKSKYIYVNHLDISDFDTVTTFDDFLDYSLEITSAINFALNDLPDYHKSTFEFTYQYDLREDAREIWSKIVVPKNIK